MNANGGIVIEFNLNLCETLREIKHSTLAQLQIKPNSN